jgi:hypothetical protein
MSIISTFRNSLRYFSILRNIEEFFRRRDPVPIWPDHVREFVEYKQEVAYRLLGDQIGMGGDPGAVRSKLLGERPPRTKLSPEEFRDKLGLKEKFSPRDWNRTKRQIREEEARPTTMPTPTRYEDPITYKLMYEIRRAINDDFARLRMGREFPAFLASLPSGDVNARILTTPRTKQSVLFFEQGLFQFLRDFAALASWAVPVLPQGDLTDASLAAIPQRHTMSFQASTLFASSLYSYVVEGNPRGGAARVPRPAGNAFLTEVLFIWMIKFVFLHEFAHVVLGDLEKQDTSRDALWKCEYDADASATGFLTELSKRTDDSWALAFWACDLTLIAFNFLDRALALFEFGGDFTWISPTHPQPIDRRRVLHASVPPELPDRTRQAAGNLVGMNKALFLRLWELAVPQFWLARGRGARPSPLWSERIARSMAPVS